MSPAWLGLGALLLGLGCSQKAPADAAKPAHSAQEAPDASEAEAGSRRPSQREALERDAEETGLEQVYLGWLEPSVSLGATERDGCLRVRVAAISPEPEKLKVTLREGERTREVDWPLRERWTDPLCVRAETSVSLHASGAPSLEIVVVSSTKLRN